MQIQTWPENSMKNISKTKGRHRASFASYCLEKVDNKEQRAIKTKECERQNERNKSRDTKECGREYDWNRCALEKRADGRRPGTSVRNKRKSIEDKGNRGTKQNRADGDGLELVRRTKESQSKRKDTAAQN